MSSIQSNSTNTSSKSADFRIKYKTQKCRYWCEMRHCPFGQYCAFAHYEGELRGKGTLNNNYKTKTCNNFKNFGYCKYGDRCQFLHSNQTKQPDLQDASFPSLVDDKASSSSFGGNKTSQGKHRKRLAMLQQFGVDILPEKIISRSEAWTALISGSKSIENDHERDEGSQWEWEALEDEFPEYDFHRKPRLGSL